jgi:SAM-dependent methyltransferase
MPAQKPKMIDDLGDVHRLIEDHVRRRGNSDGELRILEAGCGRRWPIDLTGVNFHLTGIDIDEHALAFRKHEVGDLDETILSDLLSADLPENSFDIIYSSFVLEHVKGAETLLQSFVKWLRPGGLLILMFPDRDSVYGFVTRITPFWVHVAYKKHIMGRTHAGTPGHGPYPTFHDKVLSRKRFREFVGNNGMHIEEERGFGKLPIVQTLFTKAVEALSFNGLSSEPINLLYVCSKAQSGVPR